MKKLNCTKDKVSEIARTFGISKQTVDSFQYQEQEPVLPPVEEADNEPKNIQLASDRLRSLIERIERLEEEKSGITSDIKDVYGEAKSAGFDPKIMRAVIKLRKMSSADRDEQEWLLETYRKALDL